MFNTYRTASGAFAPPGVLTDQEALDAFEAGELEALDVQHLTVSAQVAVFARLRRLGVSVINDGTGPRAWCLAKTDSRPVVVADGVH